MNVRRGCGCRSSPLVTTRRSSIASAAEPGKSDAVWPSGPRPEVHEVDRRRGRDLGVVRGGGVLDRVARAAHRVHRARPARGRGARRASCPRSTRGRSTGTQRSSPNHTSTPDQSSCIARPRAARSSRGRCRHPRSAIDVGASATTSVGERGGDVVDHADLTVHGGHDTDMEREHGCGLRGNGRGVARSAPSPRFLDQVPIARRGHAAGAVSVDLGCGAGLHLPYLARPVGRARRRPRDGGASPAPRRPDAWPVQADLEALPFRRRRARRRLGAAPATSTCRNERLPCALADLHRALDGRRAGAPRAARGRRRAATLADDDFPGRWFAGWDPDALRRRARGRGLRRRVAGGRRRQPVLDRGAGHAAPARCPTPSGPACGSSCAASTRRCYAADAGVGFARPGNRFWPAALAAGIVTVDRDPGPRSTGHGVGMTDLVKRATPRADELTRDEYRAGFGARRAPGRAGCSRARCASSAWPAGAPRSTATRSPGSRPDVIGGRPAYVMPSTSGLNARVPPAELADHLRAAAALADERR